MKILLRHWALILLIVHCALIFGFSAQSKSASAHNSKSISNKIVQKVDTKEMSNYEKVRLPIKVDLVVRKTAHILLFAILGVLAQLCAEKHLKKRKWIAAVLFCLLYAISDEVHQMFVPGRAGLVSDVLIDFAGSIAGIGILFVITKIKRRKKA